MTRRPERALPGDFGGRAVDKALFISLSNVGDAIMTTPALELLHARYPEHSIDIVADRRSGEIFDHCPYRGEIFYKNKRAAWRGLPALLGQLRVNFYDVVVDLRSDGLAYLLRARRRYTKWGARAARGPHAVQRLMAIVEGLLGPAEIPPQRIWVNEAAQEFARRVLADLPGRRWLVLGPGAKWPKKVWPAQRFIDMTNAVEDRFDGVIVLGGPGDVAPAAEVAAGPRLPVLNLAGQTSILEDCAVLAQAQVFVGNDSRPRAYGERGGDTDLDRVRSDGRFTLPPLGSACGLDLRARRPHRGAVRSRGRGAVASSPRTPWGPRRTLLMLYNRFLGTLTVFDEPGRAVRRISRGLEGLLLEVPGDGPPL